MTERPTGLWVAFAAGAVAALALGLIVLAWQARHAASEAVRAAVAAAKILPDLERPRLPDAPRIPDAPAPRPK